MLRLPAIILVALPMVLQAGSVWALDASDTMAAWKTASSAEKGVVVDKVLKGHGAASVVKCVDAASEAPGHADLPIAQMIKACSKADNEPV